MPYPQPVEKFVATSAAYTASANQTVLVTTGTSELTITLPPVADGAPVSVRKVDSGTGKAIVKTADSSTIDGVAGTTGVLIEGQHHGYTFAVNGASWNIVGA